MDSKKIIIAVVLLIICAVVYMMKTSADLALKTQTELNSSVGEMLTDISSTWHPQTFLKYSSPDLKDWLKDNGWDEVNRYSYLGKLKQYRGIVILDVGEDEVGLTSDVDFENGKTKIEINMLKYDDKWYINNLQINPAE